MIMGLVGQCKEKQERIVELEVELAREKEKERGSYREIRKVEMRGEVRGMRNMEENWREIRNGMKGFIEEIRKI